ncbi:MAG: hypothetical protein ACI33M_08210 [Lysinibacillus sp.]
MNKLLNNSRIISGKIYMVELDQEPAKLLRVLTETPTHIIFVMEDENGSNVFERSKQDIQGIYEIKDWYEANGM